MNKRVIKFRAWNIDHMVYEDKSTGHGKITSGWIINNYSNVMQFIGLLDKNGKEIYEGDIVRATWQTHSTGGYMQSSDAYCDNELIVSVKWANIGFAYILDNGKQTSLSRTARLEIIGNLYENPELLK